MTNKKPKKRNPTDATMRNVRAINMKLKVLAERLENLEMRFASYLLARRMSRKEKK